MGEHNKYKNEANTYKSVSNNDNVPVDYNFEKMIKTFLKQVDKEGILKEVKARRYYIKKSEKLRLEKRKRQRKNQNVR